MQLNSDALEVLPVVKRVVVQGEIASHLMGL